MSRVSYRSPDGARDGRPRGPMMARPLYEGRWSPAEAGDRRSPRRFVGPLALLLIGSVAIAGVVGLAAAPAVPPIDGALESPSPPAAAFEPLPSVTPAPPASPRPSGLSSGSSDVGVPRPKATSRPTDRPTPAPTPALPTPSPSTTPRPADWAPQSAADFDQLAQVIDIAFPLKEGTRYSYRDNWFDVREGEPEEYNHAHSRRRGEVRRAHDGIDIYARRGSPVLAPFAGTVIEPADRWSPWHGERHGKVVVIVSSEPQSEGYAAVLSHLDATFVEPGTQVRRGEVVGLAGDTGNADGFRVHLHFELRAPFGLPWLELGGERLVDAFNPFPSLVAADPRRD